MASIDKNIHTDWDVKPAHAIYAYVSSRSPERFDVRAADGTGWPSAEEHQRRIRERWQHNDRIQCLHDKYEFKHRESVERFLAENQKVLLAVEEAPARISICFGEHIRQLRMEYDSDGLLYLVIVTDLDVEEAQRRLDALDDSWFLPLYPKLDGKLNLLLQYV